MAHRLPGLCMCMCYGYNPSAKGAPPEFEPYDVCGANHYGTNGPSSGFVIHPPL